MRARKRKHNRYFAIPAYQVLKKLTDKDVANHLGVSTRTYKDKIEGWSEFSLSEGRALSELLTVTQEELFIT